MARRIGSVMGVMLGIAGLAALLAVETARTGRRHHDSAERVLIDYAALGAEGIANRLQTLLNSRLFPILSAVENPPPPTRAALLAGLGPSAGALAGRVSWVGWIGGTGLFHAVRFDTAAAVDADLADSIRAVTTRLPDGAYFGTLVSAGQLVTFAPSRSAGEGSGAFAIPLAEIAALVDRFLDREPVLPLSLTRGAELGDRVGVTVSLGGRPFANRPFAESSRFRATHSLGPVFGEMAVEVRLAEALAPTLVIGGLPKSRVPFLAGVMALTLALAAVALFQLRQRERLAKLREDFVAGASHELRTPLAQIRLFAETLRLERVRSEDERSRAVAVIEREARRLEHLVENLLHFSRAERGTLQVAAEPVDLGPLTREIVTEFTPLASKGGVGIRVEGPESLVARADPGAWRQIVLNLLDNAVKYGGGGTQVTVGLARDAEAARLTVSDEGPGVAADERTRVWERFWRGDASRAAGVTGTGIGLATVRDLVTLQGGECWVEGAEPRGARFVVRLPGGG
ncbi:MAG: HAMP domain-containing histidine kinase [Gemmatimonadales bacterium]|nr:HAMP domain-containing histidine kinase [Gemmatimonadales bacterium]